LIQSGQLCPPALEANLRIAAVAIADKRLRDFTMAGVLFRASVGDGPVVPVAISDVFESGFFLGSERPLDALVPRRMRIFDVQA
jgi:hypothetical protein